MEWVGASPKEQEEMLGVVGVSSVDDLLTNVPRRLEGLLDIPSGMTELELIRHLEDLSRKNNPCGAGRCFLGAGAYEHAIPSVIDSLISRGEFLTAYTPYQPEISQGTLTWTFEFQSMVSEIMGLDVSNASMYDGASAMAEAALLAMRHTRRNRVLYAATLHPEWKKTLETYLSGLDCELKEIPAINGVTDLDFLEAGVDSAVACAILPSPNFFGCLEDICRGAEIVHASGALLIAVTNPLSLGVLAPPGECGADIAVADAQPLGMALNYGGPYAGLFSVKQSLVRQVPGRLAGMAWDSEGRRGFTLTLQTREQHIRREKATSNICTNQALLALSATIYLALVGRNGFQEVSRQNILKAGYAQKKLTALPGVRAAFVQPFFNEFTLELPVSASGVVEQLQKRGFWAGLDLARFYPEMENHLLVCVTETKTREDIDRFAGEMKETLS